METFSGNDSKDKEPQKSDSNAREFTNIFLPSHHTMNQNLPKDPRNPNNSIPMQAYNYPSGDSWRDFYNSTNNGQNSRSQQILAGNNPNNFFYSAQNPQFHSQETQGVPTINRQAPGQGKPQDEKYNQFASSSDQQNNFPGIDTLKHQQMLQLRQSQQIQAQYNSSQMQNGYPMQQAQQNFQAPQMNQPQRIQPRPQMNSQQNPSMNPKYQTQNFTQPHQIPNLDPSYLQQQQKTSASQPSQMNQMASMQQSLRQQNQMMQHYQGKNPQAQVQAQAQLQAQAQAAYQQSLLAQQQQGQGQGQGQGQNQNARNNPAPQKVSQNMQNRPFPQQNQGNNNNAEQMNKLNPFSQMQFTQMNPIPAFPQQNQKQMMQQMSHSSQMKYPQNSQNQGQQQFPHQNQSFPQPENTQANFSQNFQQQASQNPLQKHQQYQQYQYQQMLQNPDFQKQQQQYQNQNQTSQVQYKQQQPENFSQAIPQVFQYPQGNPYAHMASKMHPNLMPQPQMLRNMMQEKEQKIIPSPSPNPNPNPNPEQFLNNNTVQKQPSSQPPSQPQSQPHTPNTTQTQYKSQTRIQQQQTQEIATSNKSHKQMNTVQFVREIYKMTQIQQIPQSPQANNTPTTPQQQSQVPSGTAIASQQNILNPTLKHPLNMSYEQFELMRQKMAENLKQNIERMNQEYREKKQKEETISQTTETAETPTTKKSALPQPQTLSKTHSTPKKQKSPSKTETKGAEKTDNMEEEKDDKADEEKIQKPKQKRRPRNRDKSKETGKKSHKKSISRDEILEEASKEDQDGHKKEMNIETAEKPAEGGPALNLKKETSLVLTRETSSSKGKMLKKNQQFKRSHSKKLDTTESHTKEENPAAHHTTATQSQEQHDAKKSEMKIIEPKPYQELIQTMQYMSRFDWLQENSVSHKILPYKFITPAVVWFMICANYFPIEALRSPDGKKFVQETFDKLQQIHLESVQRISSTPSLESKQQPAENALEAELLSSLSQAIQTSTKNINLQEFQEQETTETRIPKQTNCEEDDEWLAETKRFVADSTKKLEEEGLLPPTEQPIPQNFNIISKLNLDDLISLYEVDLHNQALENKQQQQSLEELFSQGLNDGNMLRLIEFNREDAICDISIVYPEDEKFVSMIERKQNDNTRPAHKAGEKRIPTQEGGKTLQSNRREILQPEDSFCQICNDGESYEDNQIVFCARCNISVHQKCYGIPVVPKEDWICDLCINFDINGKYLRCPLCDKRGGAMKPTSTKADSDTFAEKNPEYHQFLKSYPKNFNYKSLVNRRPLTFRDIKRTRGSKSVAKSDDEEDGSDYQDKLYYDYHSINESDFTSEELKNEPQPPNIWIHIACAMFIPELDFGDKVEKTHIQGLEEVDKNRFVHECDICKKKQGGATINCERGLCSKWFHPECARRAKQYLEIRKIDATEVVYNIYCEKHTPLQLKRTLESKDKKNREDITRFFKALDRYYLTFLNEPRLFGLEGSAVIPPNEEVAKILAATTAAPKKKKPQENAPPTSRREDGSYYFKLVEKFRKKSCKIPCYITLQKTHDAENVETYKILEVTNPKPPLAPDRRLGEKDPIWEMMQYKGLTSLQKYRKYKKIEYKMKKKAREKEEKEKTQVQGEQQKRDHKPTKRASESKPIPEPQEARPLSEISEEEFASKGLQITIQDTQVFSDVESSRMTHTDSPFSRKRPSPPLSDKVDSGRKLSFDASFHKQGSPPKFSSAAEPTAMNIESTEQTEKGESAITEAESPKIKKKKRATVVSKADSPGLQNTNLLSLKPNQVESTSFSGGSMVEERKDHQAQNDHSVSNLLSFMLNGEEEQKDENEQIICICKRPYRGEPVICCEDCGIMCHPECISQKGDFNPSISSFKCSNCYTQLNCEESLSDMQQVLLDKRHGYHNDFEEEPDLLKKINFGMNVRNFY